MTLKHSILAFIAAASVATTAPAAEISGSTFKTGNWTGAGYTDDQNGKFLYCNALVKYSKGEVVEIAVYFDGAITFYLKNPEVKRRQGDIYEVTMLTHRDRPIYAKFEAIDNDFLAGTFTDTSNVVAWLEGATSLRVLGIDDDQAYVMDGIDQALIHMLGCAAERGLAASTAQPAPQNNNTPTGPGRLPPPRNP